MAGPKSANIFWRGSQCFQKNAPICHFPGILAYLCNWQDLCHGALFAVTIELPRIPLPQTLSFQLFLAYGVHSYFIWKISPKFLCVYCNLQAGTPRCALMGVFPELSPTCCIVLSLVGNVCKPARAIKAEGWVFFTPSTGPEPSTKQAFWRETTAKIVIASRINAE